MTYKLLKEGMNMSEMMQKVGSWAFVLGLIIAVVMAFMGTGSTTIWILAILGLIVGLLNISGSESHLFLVAAIAFLVSASSLNLVWEALSPYVSNVVVFVAPAAAVVALRPLYDVAREH